LNIRLVKQSSVIDLGSTFLFKYGAEITQSRLIDQAELRETTERTVCNDANLLEKCGSDVLSGDFQVFSSTKMLKEKEQEENRKVFNEDSSHAHHR